MTRDDLERARKVLGPTTDAYESPAEHLRDAMELLRKENARLTRERDEARKALDAAMADAVKGWRACDAARAHFRRACEYLATFCFSRGPAEKSVDEWQAEIVADLEGKP